MTQPTSVSIFTIGAQGPPGVGLTFAGIAPVTFAQTGLQLLSGAFYPVDTSGGPVTLLAPAATNGGFFGISDMRANATINPISIEATGVGVTISNFANPGTFGSVSLVNSPGGPTVWYAFCVGINAWIPIWW